MKNFMDKDFLLETNTARHLYHDYAKKLPLIDYHCHISPKEIYENRRFNSLEEVWLGGMSPDGTLAGDHYKWRLMRSAGISEDYITGDKDGLSRIKKFAEALELSIGNPMYHWCNLELKKYFDIDEPFSSENCDKVFENANKKLQNDENMTVRGLIKQSNVAFIGTTDDPIDSLEWHKKIKEDKSIEFKVSPSFRPDKAINIRADGFKDYILKLAKSVNKENLSSADEVCEALSERLLFFKENGCKISDHGLDYVMFRPANADAVNKIFKKALKGKVLSLEEAEKYQTYILLHLGREYKRHSIVMQLHYSCLRNNNRRMYERLGVDSGFDMIAQNTCGGSLAELLSALDSTNSCPKAIIYSLNPADNAQIGTLIGCFQTDEIPGKIQMGSAWWFNDTKQGMENQLSCLANLGVLGTFVGMLTDSRSFLSYTRHEYFRRILCNFIGNLVENGEYPNDEKALKKIVEGICYYNAARYFDL